MALYSTCVYFLTVRIPTAYVSSPRSSQIAWIALCKLTCSCKMTVGIKLTTWCTFVVRFMRDQLAYEKVHAFQAHYQSIDQEVKKYKKDLTGKNPKAKIDEAHVTLVQGQPMRQALGVRTLGSFGSTQD